MAGVAKADGCVSGPRGGGVRSSLARRSGLGVHGRGSWTPPRRPTPHAARDGAGLRPGGNAERQAAGQTHPSRRDRNATGTATEAAATRRHSRAPVARARGSAPQLGLRAPSSGERVNPSPLPRPTPLRSARCVFQVGSEPAAERGGVCPPRRVRGAPGSGSAPTPLKAQSRWRSASGTPGTGRSGGRADVFPAPALTASPPAEAVPRSPCAPFLVRGVASRPATRSPAPSCGVQGSLCLAAA